jgi:formamidopyrimidine-DNA glycosylase
MPELPEVETAVRELEPELTGRTITAARVFWPRTIAEPLAEEFPARIAGLAFATFDRRGKYMLLGMSDDSTLIVHLRMTGKLLLLPAETTPHPHTHVVMELDNGAALHYNDPRKFGRIWLVPDRTTVLAKLGPEPLAAEFGVDDFAARLAGRNAPIKSLLLDQRLVAGVGNIYADEALFRAGIHPTRAGGSLTVDEMMRLHSAIRDVLNAAITHRGSTLGSSNLQNYRRPGGMPGDFQNEFFVYGRTGEPCLVCGAPVARIVLGQRSTHFCPACQPV